MIDLQTKVPKILVIGDLIIDQYLWGSCERISPEAPVQIVNIDSENIVLGGAGNVINNLKSLGASVDVISVIGSCDTSKELKKLLKEINVDTQFLITQNNRITSKKSRVVAAQQQVIRYDREFVDLINKKSIRSIINIFNSIITNYDSVLLSDYGKGVLTSDLTQSIIKIAKKYEIKVLVDPKGKDYSKYKGAYLLTPNKKEASVATNISIDDNDSLTRALRALKNKCKLDVSLITLSEHGVAIFDKELRVQPTSAIEVFDVTGAGDTILASLGFALSCNKNIDDAVKFANLAAGIVVGKIGSATASMSEIIEHESKLNKISSDQKIKSLKEISLIVSSLKHKNKRIVFTNGCFDILHIGHIKYLEEAKSFGDILILGLNSDTSVRKIKGNDRPINSQNERAYIISALDLVDYVVIFNEETPFDLIKNINPDILVKGGDYEGTKIEGQDIVKEFKIVKFIDGVSTSKIIEKIKNI